MTKLKENIRMKFHSLPNLLMKGAAFMLATSLLAGCQGAFASSSGASADKEKTSVTQSNSKELSDKDTQYPIRIKHALGETVIEKKPERVATIFWGNQDVALAFGIVPVGVSEANYGVTDGSGLLPWTLDKFKELGVEDPVLFHDTDGLDYEAISDVNPDVILAGYSGITQEEYDTLSEIAPVVAYPNAPWQTSWREQIRIDSRGLGMEQEGKDLVKDLEQMIQEKVAEYPQLKDKTAGFLYITPSDLGKVYVYLKDDPRGGFLTDLGMNLSREVENLGTSEDGFSMTVSAENVDVLNGLDIIVAYGDDQLLKTIQEDPLFGTIPAIKRGSVVFIENNTPLAASGTPSALSIPATIDEYLSLLGKAANKVQ